MSLPTMWKKKKREANDTQSKKKRCDNKSLGLVSLKMEEKTMSQECTKLLEAGRSKEADSSHSLQHKQPPTQTQFEFSPVHPCCASQLQNPKMITSCCLKPQSIVIRNSCRKHTHSLASWEYSFFPHHKAGFSQGEGAYLSHFHTLGLCHKVNARNTLWGFLK